jgi:pimeloyl-ACP methyl ester carboxylesterase
MGELGSGNEWELPRLLGHALPQRIAWGQFPTSFTVNGQTHKFIVISPQFRNWPSPGDIDATISYAIQNYKVNPSRIYVTGLSMGGGATWEYAGYSSAYANRVAAIVPICGASWPEQSRARTIASANVAVWATHNDGDATVPLYYTDNYISAINQAPAPNPMARKSIFSSGSHDAWSWTYNPAFRENGLNIYEWMLQYSRGGGGSNPVPLPTPSSPIPGKVEAEGYSSANGIQTENTADAGGGQNVGYIDNGDWMEYSVNVPSYQLPGTAFQGRSGKLRQPKRHTNRRNF